MNFFSESVIKPYLRECGYRRLCEIGGSEGANTDLLLRMAEVSLEIIDPGLDSDLGHKYRGLSRVRIHKGLSLEVLPRLAGPFDCILIDGDHNWYTVYHELKTIEERGLLLPGGTIFLHDVGHPYGRRDMYYLPESIPAEFRHPHAKKGIVEGESELSESAGTNAGLFNAEHEGGPRNGVLTAVEDFLSGHPGFYRFFRYEEEFGLGVLFRRGNRRGDWAFRKRRFRYAIHRRAIRRREKEGNRWARKLAEKIAAWTEERGFLSGKTGPSG